MDSTEPAIWCVAQSDQLFKTFVDHPRQTTVISSCEPGGPPLSIASARSVEQSIRDRADAVRIPVVVRTLAIAYLPGYAHVVVYHVPDVTRDAERALDRWDNDGGALAAPAHQPGHAA